jgi:hypothetical protein
MASKKRRTHPQYLPEVRRNEELDELFVFGYACKIFRDNVKAVEINKGQHLIPWMGNPKLLIDRFVPSPNLMDFHSRRFSTQKGSDLKFCFLYFID